MTGSEDHQDTNYWPFLEKFRFDVLENGKSLKVWDQWAIEQEYLEEDE